jgi:NAD+ synthase (glutamine-hydrolysing)
MMKIQIAQINSTVGDLTGNKEKIVRQIRLAKDEGADLVVFPEMALAGYPADDLLLLPQFIDETEYQLHTILKETKGICALVGMPRKNSRKGEKGLFNSAAVLSNGEIAGYYDKMLLPTYDVFSETRYFEPGKEAVLWDIAGKKVAVTICEDIWQHAEAVTWGGYDRDPVMLYDKLSPDLLINLSSSPYSLNKPAKRFAAGSKAAKTLQCPVIICNQVGGNDSLIFDGYSVFVDKEGSLIERAKGFCEDSLFVDLEKKGKPKEWHTDVEGDLFRALALGLKDYFAKLGFKKACLGMSGGIDSVVTACIAVHALGPENVLAVCMPSRYSSQGSVDDSKKLAKNLKIDTKWISIEEPFEAYLELLEPHFEGKEPDTTEENIQARIRSMILMALSNKHGYIVLSTGNKSEMALGYSTLYGDMSGGVGVLSDVTKRQVYALAEWINREEEIIPKSVIQKPPSAELRPNQKDSDNLPEYAVVDAVLDDYIVGHLSSQEIADKHEYPLDLVDNLIKRIHMNEYKRRQSPPGLRVSEKAFSAGRRFPIVQKWA